MSTSTRTVLAVPLRPIMGSRFQPTGFPDLGAATFDRPLAEGGWQRDLLVESAQSMANRLEGTAWDSATNQPREPFARLPWVRVSANDAEGRYLTSSRTEAHRLASAFVRQSTLDGDEMLGVIKDRLNLRDDTPLAPRAIARAIFALDPFCLLHGVFFSDSGWIGQPKVLRAITACVEAHDIREAVSGGVKRDHVRLSLEGKDGGTAEGYGSVPFSRMEYTAASIEATFVLDRAQLDSYGLPAPARQLLENIALWEIRTLLDGGLRLRTACDLEPLASWHDDRLPSADELETTIERLVSEVLEFSDEHGPLVPNPGPLDVRWSGGKKNAKKAQ